MFVWIWQMKPGENVLKIIFRNLRKRLDKKA